MDEFSTLDIVRILGIPRERLREWLNHGFIRPSIQEAKGQGTKALFSRNDLYLIAMFRDLVETGLSRLSAAACAHQIERQESSTADYAVFRYRRYRNREFINARTGESDKKKKDALIVDVRFAMNKLELQKAFDPKGSWDHVLVVNLKKVKKEIDTLIG